MRKYIDKYPALWANLPSYCVGKSFVRLIEFKDHINIEAQAVISHKEELADYKITPKGMLQIYLKEDIPEIRYYCVWKFMKN